jgi:thioredoxin reductase (NADPH)
MTMIVPIIGGGPSGMSCALWLANYGFAPVIIERSAALGGMAHASPYPNEWLLGRPGETARDNAEAFARHIRRAGIEVLTGTRPQRIRRERDHTLTLELASSAPAGRSLSCRALVIATGTRFRGEDWLERVGDARRLAHRVHLGPPWAGEPGTDPGSHVAVIGGGDNAFDISRMLAERGVQATLVMRSPKPRAQALLVERLRRHEASGTATVVAGRAVAALEEQEEARGLRLRLDDGAHIDVDHVLLLFGYQPNTDDPWLGGLAPRMDAHGYLEVDGNMETSCNGVFAAGDVANPGHPCIATAIASGTMAAREIQRRFAQGCRHGAASG